ncbi:hypothetical protein MicB006_0561 [Micromonospora sp. B006]|nr:hypothetical protein MicB006_0561 [Micromonospora sp. B006]
MTAVRTGQGSPAQVCRGPVVGAGRVGSDPSASTSPPRSWPLVPDGRRSDTRAVMAHPVFVPPAPGKASNVSKGDPT